MSYKPPFARARTLRQQVVRTPHWEKPKPEPENVAEAIAEADPPPPAPEPEVVVEPEPEVVAAAEPEAEAAPEPSMDMKRSELNAMATERGVEDPEGLANKQAVIDAINNL